VVQFRKGSYDVFLKLNFDGPFQEHPIFKKSVLKDIMNEQDRPIEGIPKEIKKRGISQQKKRDLVNLSKHMPINRQQFYKDMEVGDADDLMNVRECDF